MQVLYIEIFELKSQSICIQQNNWYPRPFESSAKKNVWRTKKVQKIVKLNETVRSKVEKEHDKWTIVVSS